MKYNVLILESDDEFGQAIKNAFDCNDEFTVVGITSNGNIGINLLKDKQVDILIMNLVLSGVDGFAVIDYVKQNNINCKIIIVSNFADDKIISSAIARGANYYFVKPVSVNTVFERISDLMVEKSVTYNASAEVRDKRRASSIDEKISNIFISIGIPPHIKGYAYLRESIKMAIETPAIINNITKQLYPNVAEKFYTSASKVERAIRHAIEVAWNRGRIDAINAIFGVRVYIGSEKPTNSEFIALVADKLILEELI